MANVRPAIAEVRNRLRCNIEWPVKDRCEGHSGTLADLPTFKAGKKRFTKESKQDLEISGLKQELAQVRKLLGMVLVLVDPEDVRAALELPRITPSHETLLRMAETCQPPDEPLVDEERPW